MRALCDRYTVLRDGESVATGELAGVAAETIVAQMVGRDMDELYPRTPRTAGEAVLEIQDLGACDLMPQHATLTLHRGEVVGIAGLVGAGRTELLRAIFGLKTVCSGEVRLKSNAAPTTPKACWRGGMGMVSEDRQHEGLAFSLSIADNLMLTNLGFLVDPKLQDVSAESWIKRLRVRCAGPRQDIGDLSGGNQQKVAIARLLEHDVDVLLLDEPTRGIDVGSKAQIYRLIDELGVQGQGGAGGQLLSAGTARRVRPGGGDAARRAGRCSPDRGLDRAHADDGGHGTARGGTVALPTAGMLAPRAVVPR